jgi:hypothetical protein
MNGVRDFAASDADPLGLTHADDSLSREHCGPDATYIIRPIPGRHRVGHEGERLVEGVRPPRLEPTRLLLGSPFMNALSVRKLDRAKTQPMAESSVSIHMPRLPDKRSAREEAAARRHVKASDARRVWRGPTRLSVL